MAPLTRLGCVVGASPALGGIVYVNHGVNHHTTSRGTSVVIRLTYHTAVHFSLITYTHQCYRKTFSTVYLKFRDNQPKKSYLTRPLGCLWVAYHQTNDLPFPGGLFVLESILRQHESYLKLSPLPLLRSHVRVCCSYITSHCPQ